jgi:hypothetical protein
MDRPCEVYDSKVPKRRGRLRSCFSSCFSQFARHRCWSSPHIAADTRVPSPHTAADTVAGHHLTWLLTRVCHHLTRLLTHVLSPHTAADTVAGHHLTAADTSVPLRTVCLRSISTTQLGKCATLAPTATPWSPFQHKSCDKRGMQGRYPKIEYEPHSVMPHLTTLQQQWQHGKLHATESEDYGGLLARLTCSTWRWPRPS